MTARSDSFEEYLSRKQREHGEKWNPNLLAPQFVPHFHGNRIRVRTTYDDGTTFERTGRVSVTTGWMPVFLLVHRSNAYGSWDTLAAEDEVVAVQGRGRKYVDVTGKSPTMVAFFARQS